MAEELTKLPPETFFRMATERGGLDLEDVIQDLSPQAADALRHIAASSPPPTTAPRSKDWPDATRSAAPPPPRPERICSACGRLNQPRDNFCRTCGRPLDPPKPAPVTLDDLVKQGRLTAQQADEVRVKLDFLQSNYTAGTRYSVFG